MKIVSKNMTGMVASLLIMAALILTNIFYGAGDAAALSSFGSSNSSDGQVDVDTNLTSEEDAEQLRNGDPVQGELIFNDVQQAEDPWKAVDELTSEQNADLQAALKNDPTLEIEPTVSLQGNYESWDHAFWANMEKVACLRYLTLPDCNEARDLAVKAQRDAEYRFPGQMHNAGRGDAFRHCWWSASMTIDINETAAKIVGTNHEDLTPRERWNQADREMDLFNNAQGRWAAVASGYRWWVAVELCDQWARNGTLRVNAP